MMRHFYLEDGTKLSVNEDNPLGKGGEGTVYALPQNTDILLKVYTKRALKRMPNIESKIKNMTQKPPSLQSYQDLTIIAWPQKVVYNKKHEFIGYLMHAVNAKNNLSHIITPGLQKKKFPDITWKDRLVIAINLALVMDQIHKNDAVIGDINTSDFFVYPQFEIGVVDTDSFQILSKHNELFHCNVFTPDYTPPEIIRAQASGDTIKRTPNNDNYGLAILVFQILMNGVHPFSARISRSLEFDGNAINYCMENEIFPYHSDTKSIKPPKNAMPLAFLPDTIQTLFIKAFQKYDPKGEARPTAEEWTHALRDAKSNLKHCRKNKHHYYPRHFKKCPHCLKEKTKDYDYLLKRLAGIDSHYTTYKDEKNRPIHIKDGSPIMASMTGNYYQTKQKNRLAKFYSSKALDADTLSDRALNFEKSKPSKVLSHFVLKPTNKLYLDDTLIGMVYQRKQPFYRLSSFLKSKKVGKTKITEKTRVKIAIKVTELFKQLEKLSMSVEFEQLYIDTNLNLLIPDVELLGGIHLNQTTIRIHPKALKPPEYHMHLKYKATLETKEAPSQPPIEVVKEKPKETPPDGFKFETSDSNKPVKNKKKPKEEAVPVVPDYDPFAKNTLRFHMAILIHKLLLYTHPYEGVYNTAPKSPEFFIKQNLYLHEDHTRTMDIKDHSRIMDNFPKQIQSLFSLAFGSDTPHKSLRPAPLSWKRALKTYKHQMRQCQKDVHHYHPYFLAECPLCFKRKHKDPEKRRAFFRVNRKKPFDYLLNWNIMAVKFMFVALLVGLLVLVNQHASESTSLALNSPTDLSYKISALGEAFNFQPLLNGIGYLFNNLIDFLNTLLS